MAQAPQHGSYDVVIVGGAMVGSSVAWWTARNPDFTGRILVVERDPTYAHAATSHTNSCIRQQFSSEANIRMSQFGAAFIHGFRDWMDDDTAPDLRIHSFGYLYLAATPAFRDILSQNVAAQNALGAATRMMTRADIAAAYPFYHLDDIVGGAHNTVDEGYFDGGTIFDWFRRKARVLGADYVQDAVTGLDMDGARVTHVRLAVGRADRLRHAGQCRGHGRRRRRRDGGPCAAGRAAPPLYLRLRGRNAPAARPAADHRPLGRARSHRRAVLHGGRCGERG